MVLKANWASGELYTAGDQNAVAAAVNALTTSAFSTNSYPQVGGDDRPRVASAVSAAVAAMASTGEDQTVLIHAPMTFTTGVTQAALSSTADPFNASHVNQGVPIPVNLPHTLNIVFAPGAKITLTSGANNAFYINKVADYDVFQNVNFYNAWVDGDNRMVGDGHALIGNMPRYSAKLFYLSFQDINFFGVTKFTNMYWNAAPADGTEIGQSGIAFMGEHASPLEATQTFSKNIYIEHGDMEGGGGLLYCCSTVASRSRPGGCNHYYDNIAVDRYRVVNPTASTLYFNGTGGNFSTGIYICGAGFGDRCRIGPGYIENIGDNAIEVGAMQSTDIIEPHSKDPFAVGITLRNTHAPIDVNTQKINIRGMRCDVTTAISNTTGAWVAPVYMVVDDQVITLSCTASGGTFTLTVPGKGTTAAIARNASAATIAAALVAIGCTDTTAMGGPLGTSTVTARVGEVSLGTPITFTSSLTGGSLTLSLAPGNASFGTITIEDAVFTADGLSYPDYGITDGLFISGLDQPHKKVELIRPKIVLSNYTYNNASDVTLTLLHPRAPYRYWGHLMVRDYTMTLAGACDFSVGAGTATLAEIQVDGQYTVADIDGMINDRAAAANGNLYMVLANSLDSLYIAVTARNLFPKTTSSSSTNRGIRLAGTGYALRFDCVDSDFTYGTFSVGGALDLTTAAGNAAYVKFANNRYPTAPVGGTISPTGSPFTWQNLLGMTAVVTVAGGTVTVIARGDRDATYITSGLTSGTFVVDTGAYLKVTYSSAPTMTYELLS